MSDGGGVEHWIGGKTPDVDYAIDAQTATEDLRNALQLLDPKLRWTGYCYLIDAPDLNAVRARVLAALEKLKRVG